MGDTVGSYAEGHLLAAHTGVAMFGAAASRHQGSRWGRELAELTSEIEADRDSLEEILRRLGVDPSSVTQRALRAAMGAVGHASRALHWGAGISTLSELEKLRNGVAAKTVGWEVLLAAAAHDQRLFRVELEQLLQRAHDQSERLRTIHLQMAQQLLEGSTTEDEVT